MSERRSPRRVRLSKAKLTEPERQFLLQCLGDEDFFSADSGSDFESLPGSPRNDADEALAKRIRFLLSKGDSDGEDELPNDAGLSLETIHAFDPASLARLGKRNVLNYIFIDDDEEEDGCTEGIEEIFSFDMDKVAEALRRGVDRSELSSVIEEAMVKDLPVRISRSQAMPSSSSTLTPRTGELSGLMTPPSMPDLEGLMTPPKGPASSCGQGKRFEMEAELAARLEPLEKPSGGRQSCPARAGMRRSSIAQHPQLLEAVSAATARHRRSMAKVVEAELRQDGLRPSVAAKVRRSVASAQRHRRASFIRAAEVLEVAGVGVGESGAQEEVLEQLDVVQQAVEEAARRHRQSIIVAVAHVTNTIDEEEPEPLPEGHEDDAPLSPTSPTSPASPLNFESYLQDAVNEIIAAAFAATEVGARGAVLPLGGTRAFTCPSMILPIYMSSPIRG
ncbi:unnamed protein product [Effrenium voratum]|nr:unnamed protein product [Effrenium voratum]